jgi:hypothetical protein
MDRYARLAAASVVSFLLVAGCSAGGRHYHDKLTCKMFANAVSVAESSGSFTHFRSAMSRDGKQRAEKDTCRRAWPET